ncbi:PREDICTED: WW domain-binding protein 11-like [Priapulus caudatus]|uniref:WW domain-binding protein 11-like n=1 Tax=Priapulus caudatus TaxID=37621 RepID=A0ABM1ERA6_PRICU|nr:PREDICTED: WW domain-binding protein 11-like [Priapulus caudatus]
MGRRSISTTKSGKFMNPTDQARKEARKKELKKNKKQRQLVRAAVLKGKDPQQLIVELEAIDQMEFDPNNPPSLNEKVLKDKRKKLKDTFDRVMRLYEKEDPEMYVMMRKWETDYNKKRQELMNYFDAVKQAQRVQLEEIPLPDMPGMPMVPAQIPLPQDIPLPHGILKRSLPGSIPGPPSGPVPRHVIEKAKKRSPPGPPPGQPPELSDYSSDEEMEDDDEEEEDEEEEYNPAEEFERLLEERKQASAILQRQQEEMGDLMETDTERTAGGKNRTIRFADDQSWNPEDEEKDTRVKYKPAVSPLVAKMLRMAGQEVPMIREPEEVPLPEKPFPRKVEEHIRPPGTDVGGGEEESALSNMPSSAPQGAPPGPPPGLTAGMPPGMFPTNLRPPPLRQGVQSTRMLPPGPPPGRPAGMPPGPPPGLPPNVRPPNVRPEENKSATIEAKPQIRSSAVDITRFMPTSLKVKRDTKTKQKQPKPSALGCVLPLC